MTRLLLIQHTNGPEPKPNRASLRVAVQAALADVESPVDLVMLPEASQADFGPGDRPLTEVAEPLDGPFVQMLGELARNAEAPVVAGMFERVPDALPFNTLVVVDPSGAIVTTYRKTHLYDAFGDRESDQLSAGEAQAVTFDLAGRDEAPIRVGLMTCYDLRFPEQARALVDAGADLLVVPAAWLRGPNKELHWTTLLAARAIENTVPVAGVAKSGARYCGLSRVVDPMGLVVAGLGEADGWVQAEISVARTEQVRAVNPSLANRRWAVTPRD